MKRFFSGKKKVGPESSTPNKKGVDFREVGLRDFDLVLFKGGDDVSGFIRGLERYQLGNGDFSHVGIILTSKSLRFRNLEDNKLYIFESTMSGHLSDGVPNYTGHSYLGSQLRDFAEVLKAYDAPPHTAVAVRRIKDNPLDVMDINEVRERCSFIFGEWDHRPYQVVLWELFCAMFPSLRRFRIRVAEKQFVFCSELAAIIYKEFGIMPPNTVPSDVVPVDFVTQDQDHQVDRTKFEELQYIRYIPNYTPTSDSSTSTSSLQLNLKSSQSSQANPPPPQSNSSVLLPQSNPPSSPPSQSNLESSSQSNLESSSQSNLTPSQSNPPPSQSNSFVSPPSQSNPPPSQSNPSPSQSNSFVSPPSQSNPPPSQSNPSPSQFNSFVSPSPPFSQRNLSFSNTSFSSNKNTPSLYFNSPNNIPYSFNSNVVYQQPFSSYQRVTRGYPMTTIRTLY